MKTRLAVSLFLGYLVYPVINANTQWLSSFSDVAFFWIVGWIGCTVPIYVIFLFLENLYLKHGKH